MSKQLCIDAYHQALRIAHSRRAAIETLVDELLEESIVRGDRLYEIIAGDGEAISQELEDSFLFKEALPQEVRRHADLGGCVAADVFEY